MKILSYHSKIASFGLLFGLLILLAACDTTKKAVATKPFDWEVDKKMVDFGAVKKGEKRMTTYTLTNKGTQDITIGSIDACECTTTEFERSLPIKPGENTVINVTFDSTEKEESETIEINIFFEQEDPETGYPLFERVHYKFELIDRSDE